VELSLQWLLLKVKIRVCITAGPCPREDPRWAGALHLVRTLLSMLLALTSMSQECKILPVISVTTRESRTCGQHEAEMLTQQCGFLQLRYRWQIEFEYKQQKMILNLACSLTCHHRVTLDLVFAVADRYTGMPVWW